MQTNEKVRKLSDVIAEIEAIHKDLSNPYEVIIKYFNSSDGLQKLIDALLALNFSDKDNDGDSDIVDVIITAISQNFVVKDNNEQFFDTYDENEELKRLINLVFYIDEAIKFAIDESIANSSFANFYELMASKLNENIQSKLNSDFNTLAKDVIKTFITTTDVITTVATEVINNGDVLNDKVEIVIDSKISTNLNQNPNYLLDIIKSSIDNFITYDKNSSELYIDSKLNTHQAMINEIASKVKKEDIDNSINSKVTDSIKLYLQINSKNSLYEVLSEKVDKNTKVDDSLINERIDIKLSNYDFNTLINTQIVDNYEVTLKSILESSTLKSALINIKNTIELQKNQVIDLIDERSELVNLEILANEKLALNQIENSKKEISELSTNSLATILNNVTLILNNLSIKKSEILNSLTTKETQAINNINVNITAIDERVLSANQTLDRVNVTLLSSEFEFMRVENELYKLSSQAYSVQMEFRNLKTLFYEQETKQARDEVLVTQAQIEEDAIELNQLKEDMQMIYLQNKMWGYF